MPVLLVAALAGGWAVLFSYLAVVRHLAGGSHAEDLGFTDQVLWSSLHGRLFHMSIYSGAQAWNTELNLSQIARPDSLLAFHFEPMLLGLLPVYAASGITGLLVLQAVALGAGAIPAFRITRYLTGSMSAGVAVAVAYLLSPLGQWAVLADFHTSALAVPLLLLSLDRLLVGHSKVQALALAAVALTAREDVAPVVVALGCALLLLGNQTRPTGAAMVAVGVAWAALALGVIHVYSGGATPFEVRYASAIHDPLAALSRGIVGRYLLTILLSGGWLALLAPLALLPAVPTLLLNILSSSPWMASGQAHYSVLLLPFLALGAAFALARLRAWPRLQRGVAAGLVCSGLVGYAVAGAGPFGANYAPATVNQHATAAVDLAASLPPDAAVSASSSLVPHLSQRQRVYVFPAMLDADYVFVDLRASPAPTSAEDVYLRVQNLLASGDWRMDRTTDDLVLLSRSGDAEPVAAGSVAGPSVSGAAQAEPRLTVSFTRPKLVEAKLVPSPDGAIDVDGPHWILRTTWQTDQPLQGGLRPEFWINLSSGETLHRWDIADVWWNPPDEWPVGQPVTIDIPDIPKDIFKSWSATWTQ